MDPGASSNAVFNKRFKLTGDSDEMRLAQQSMLDALQKHDYGPSSCFAIRLALEEALSNAFIHGNKNDPAKIVMLDARVDDELVVIEIKDQGRGFDPGAVPDPTAEENIEIPSGRGIILMRSFMTEVTFAEPGNCVRMLYRRPGTAV